MTGVFPRSAADDDDAAHGVGDRNLPADLWLDAMERWGSALERGDHDEVDRLVRQSRAARGAVHAVERLGVTAAPVDPMTFGGADS